MKVISYSLFGYGTRFDNCFDFNSYLRGVLINIRLARLVYPDWVVVLNTDRATIEHYPFLKDICTVILHETMPLTQAMLWRLYPLYIEGVERVICRDLDSPLTLREAKCVKYWEGTSKAAHAITDSVSHTIPMLGGMIGFVKREWTDKTKTNQWEQLFHTVNYDWAVKGADQRYLNEVIYPLYAQPGWDSITQHYIKGMPHTWLSDYHNEVPQMEYLEEMAESNDTCGHIGAAGYYPAPLFKFLQKHKDRFTDLIEFEKQYPEIFYWTADGTFD